MRSALVVVATIALGFAGLAAQAPPSLPGAANEIRILPIRGNIYLLAGGGANIVASVGKDGVLLVDSGAASMTQKVLAAVQDLSRRVTAQARPLRSCVGVSQGCAWWTSSEYLPTTAGPRVPRPIAGIINTSDDADHISGNRVISAAGHTYGVRNLATNTTPGAWIIAHENVTLRLSQGPQSDLVATETYFGRDKKLNFFNGEGVVIMHAPNAHTDGDSIVYFRGSDVVAAGDIINMTSYPVIDAQRGGTIQGTVDALNRILDVAIVEHMMEGGTMIVPGHGRITDAADVAYYRDMMTIMRDRIRNMRDNGMTLAQISAARPTRDYDARYGKNPAWTPAMFIEAIYRTLPKAS